MKKKSIFWELMGYITLIGLIIGQITVGYWYLFAQLIYLFCNAVNVVRDFSECMPCSYKVKDICFTAITIGLIFIWIF